jgi:putative ABC transport system permease protein
MRVDVAAVRRFVLRLANWLRPGDGDADLARELSSHLRLLQDDFERRGMSPGDARAAAKRAFGGVEQAKELHRSARTFASLVDARNDVRYAVRTLRRHPGFTAAAALILAVAIGLNTAVFSVVDAALFKGFRLVDQSDRIVYVHSTHNGQFSGVSYPDFIDWRRQATTSFAGAMGLVGDLKVLCDDTDGTSEVCDTTRITAEGLRLVAPAPIRGRPFVAADDTAGATPVAILSYTFWDRRFGRDPAVIGTTLRLRSTDSVPPDATGTSSGRGTPTTIIGVMPEGFAFPQDTELWVPLVPTTPDLERRDARSEWFAFGRLAPGATRESAQAELDTIGSRLTEAYPASNRGEKPTVETFAEFFVDPNAPVIYRALWGAVAFVLLIACANLANLCLARAASRAREMSIRAALGAGRWRIVRQLLIESLVLTGVGAAAGWLVGRWAIRIYVLASNPPAGRWNHNLLDYSVDASAFVYVVGVSIAAGVLFGLAPAVWLSRTDLNAVMKDGGRTAGDRRGRGVSGLLIVVEVSLAMILIVGAGLMARSFVHMYTADIGARTENMASMFLRLPDSRYPDRSRQVSFYERLTARLEGVSGVGSAALGPAPASGGAAARTPFEVYGSSAVDEQHRPRTAVAVVGPDYFQTLGTRLLAGREFTDGDRAAAPSVAVVNERLAREQWPNGGAVGQRVRLTNADGNGQWLSIVGVARDVIYDPRRQQVTPMVYVPYAQSSVRVDPWVQVRTVVAPEAVLGALRREVNRLDSDVVVWLGPDVLHDQIASTAYGRAGRETALLGLFAGIALFLAAMGVYAVLASSVNQRIPEIGVRTAMGATATDIRALILRQGMLPVAIGLPIGTATALALAPVLKSQLTGVLPNDPVAVILGAGVLTLAAVLGCMLPAHRASRISPVVALRND